MKNNTAQKNIPQNWQEVSILDCFNIPAKVAGIKQSQYETSGEFPVFDQGQKYISGYSSNNELLIKNVPAIIFGDHTRVVKYIENPFIAGADGTKIFWAKDNFNPAFLYYLVLNQKIPNTGYNRHFKFFKDIKVLLPDSKKEQQKIAEVLRAVDENIAKTQEVIRATEKLKKGLMQELFTRGIGHTKFKKNKLGEIPEEWEVVKLEDIGTNYIGLTYSPKNVTDDLGTLVLRSSNVRDGHIFYGDNVYVNSDIPEHLITKKGDILLCTRNGSRNLIGKCAFIDENSAGHSFGAFMSVYRTKHSDFIFQIFLSNIFKNQINKFLGATINQITNSSLNSFVVPLPSIEEQKEIVKIISAVDEKINVNKKLKNKLTLLKKGLMQDLLSGKVRV